MLLQDNCRFNSNYIQKIVLNFFLDPWQIVKCVGSYTNIYIYTKILYIVLYDMNYYWFFKRTNEREHVLQTSIYNKVHAAATGSKSDLFDAPKIILCKRKLKQMQIISMPTDFF